MCGIAGIVDFDNDMLKETKTLSAMMDALSHRGPDAAGTFITHQAALGHRRLIVVDPAGGSQPMTRCLGENTYTIVYNGEIYNTQELRKALKKKAIYFFHTPIPKCCFSRIWNGALAVWIGSTAFLLLLYGMKRSSVCFSRGIVWASSRFLLRVTAGTAFCI